MASTFKGESQSRCFSPPGNPGQLCILGSSLSVTVFGARGKHCAVFYPHRLNPGTSPTDRNCYCFHFIQEELKGTERLSPMSRVPQWENKAPTPECHPRPCLESRLLFFPQKLRCYRGDCKQFRKPVGWGWDTIWGWKATWGPPDSPLDISCTAPWAPILSKQLL